MRTEGAELTPKRRALAVLVLMVAYALCGVMLSCDASASSSPGLELGAWSPCVYEPARSCDEVCADAGQACAAACDASAVAYSSAFGACELDGSPDWSSSWETAASFGEAHACEAILIEPYVTCCCVP